jgi:hypothetical protein
MDTSVKSYYIRISGALMQAIDVLRDEAAKPPVRLQLGNGASPVQAGPGSTCASGEGRRRDEKRKLSISHVQRAGTELDDYAEIFQFLPVDPPRPLIRLPA